MLLQIENIVVTRFLKVDPAYCFVFYNLHRCPSEFGVCFSGIYFQYILIYAFDKISEQTYP
jgi:hypothetical protein